MMKKIIVLFFAMFFVACVKNDVLVLPSQNLKDYKSENYHINTEFSQKLKENYLKHFFNVWSIKKTNVNMQYLTNSILNNTGYGENYQQNPKNIMLELTQNANFEKMNEVSKNAIIINSDNLRLLPTKKPKFSNPTKAGEGYPFDYLQNSYIYAYTPIRISHFSKDLAWAFIYSDFIVGFIESKNIAYISEEDMQDYKNTQDFIMPKKDKIPLLDDNGNFVEYASIGMALALSSEDDNYYWVKVFKKDINNNAKMIISMVDKKYFYKLGDEFSSDDLEQIANELMGQVYAWGGTNGNRDCSAFLKDIFATFGVYLERNSQAQIKQRDYLNRTIFFDLSKLNDKQKYDYIKKNAIPFASLLALKGHIALYLGEFDNKIYILHNLWGIKNYIKGVENRLIVGKVAITPIDIGKNLKSVKEKDILLNKIYGMRNLFSYDEELKTQNNSNFSN